MAQIQIPDRSSSDENNSSNSSSTLSLLSRTPTPPPERRIPVIPTRRRVRINPVTEDSNYNNDVLREIIKHENIVDFVHVEADHRHAAKDGPEDPDYDHANPPEYIARFTDIRTLEEIIKRNRKPPGLPTSKAPAGLTEGMVWHVMLSVLRALRFLHHGVAARPSHKEKGKPIPNWMPIVHNGIRPENIILEHPIAKTSKHLPFRYGACKLGNFARCVLLPSVDELGEEDSENLTEEEQEAIAERHDAFQTLFHGGETHGYEAPEIVAEDPQETEYPAGWSDLWSLGAVAVEMMTGRNVWDLLLEIEFEDRAEANQGRGHVVEKWHQVSIEHRHEILREYVGEARVVEGLPELYSHGLRVLVEALLVHNPWMRGDAQAVLLDAEQRYEAWDKKGFRIYEREAMDDMIDEQFEREKLRHIKKAEDFLRRFEERDRA